MQSLSSSLANAYEFNPAIDGATCDPVDVLEPLPEPEAPTYRDLCIDLLQCFDCCLKAIAEGEATVPGVAAIWKHSGFGKADPAPIQLPVDLENLTSTSLGAEAYVKVRRLISEALSFILGFEDARRGALIFAMQKERPFIANLSQTELGRQFGVCRAAISADVRKAENYSFGTFTSANQKPKAARDQYRRAREKNLTT